MSVDKLYAEYAEKALIGGILAYDAYKRVSKVVKAADFFLLRHRIVYNACANVFAHTGHTTEPLLLDELRRQDKIEEIGGTGYLVELVNSVDSIKYVDVYAHLVKRIAIRRELLQLAGELPTSAIDDNIPVNELIEGYIDKLKHLQAPDIEDNLTSLSDSIAATYEQVEANRDIWLQNNHYTIGIKTGFKNLDYLLDGLRRGDASVLAGYTGAGKSACAFTIALNAAIEGIDGATKSPAKVCLFSGEMTPLAMNNRLASMASGVGVRIIERGAFNDEQHKRWIKAISFLSELPITLKRASRVTTQDLELLVEQQVSRYGLDLLVLDGILQIDTNTRYDSDWLRINAIMESLETIAVTYNIAILATHQLARSGAIGRPTLADLKRSSSVEEKAARVMLLWAPDESEPRKRELVIAKNRHGEQGVVSLYFNMSTTRFYDYSSLDV